MWHAFSIFVVYLHFANNMLINLHVNYTSILKQNNLLTYFRNVNIPFRFTWLNNCQATQNYVKVLWLSFYWKMFLFTKTCFPCFDLIKIFNSNKLIVTYSNKLDACPFENRANEYSRLQCENINENNWKQPFH